MLRYFTAGESHGKCLVAILDGFPAGIAIDIETINQSLKERQSGYGRGKRMEIESDRVEFLSGVRQGVTIGSPITIKIDNKDFKIDTLPEVIFPRPGHADLSGALKYNCKDIRDILERASARETAVRVACGALCQNLLKQFNIEVVGHVINIGGISVAERVSFKDIKERIKDSLIRCVDRPVEEKIIALINKTIEKKDTLGGIFEVRAVNVPVGLGSHAQWDRKLDARLSMAVMSIQGVKSVEIGLGKDFALNCGSQVHDEIYYSEEQKENQGSGFFRKNNNSGGIEGGISNGEDIIVKGAMKPIPTLSQPLDSVNLVTKQAHKASVERSDVCAVPACSVVAEAVVSLEITRAFLEKFGSDSKEEIERNYQGYLKQIKSI